jgi:hypothetical protein
VVEAEEVFFGGKRGFEAERVRENGWRAMESTPWKKTNENKAKGGALADALFFFFQPPQRVDHDGDDALTGASKGRRKETLTCSKGEAGAAAAKGHRSFDWIWAGATEKREEAS